MSNNPCLDTNDTITANALANAGSDWRDQAICVTNCWIKEERAFSSGEVGAAIRTHVPSSRFSVLKVGELLRERYNDGQFIDYDDGLGDSTPVVQVMRTAEGLYPQRTPPGTQVYVYAISPEAGYEHDFEVCIPNPTESNAQVQAVASAPATPVTQPTIQPVAIMGAKVATVDLKATVHADGRLCVPRSAFEACVALGGQALNGGDPVFVKASPTEVVVALVATGDADEKSYDLSRERGRVLVPSVTTPFTPGDVYQIRVGRGTLTVDLGATFVAPSIPNPAAVQVD